MDFSLCYVDGYINNHNFHVDIPDIYGDIYHDGDVDVDALCVQAYAHDVDIDIHVVNIDILDNHYLLMLLMSLFMSMLN